MHKVAKRVGNTDCIRVFTFFQQDLEINQVLKLRLAYFLSPGALFFSTKNKEISKKCTEEELENVAMIPSAEGVGALLIGGEAEVLENVEVVLNHEEEVLAINLMAFVNNNLEINQVLEINQQEELF